MPTAGVLFLLIALGHLLRIVFGLLFVVQGVSVPMWASAIAVVIAGFLAYHGLRLGAEALYQGYKPVWRVREVGGGLTMKRPLAWWWLSTFRFSCGSMTGASAVQRG